jgi:hypothetical protein
MKDQGINKGLVQKFDTSDKYSQHAFFGFRKMFWTYLNKLNIPFYDACCTDAETTGYQPVGFDTASGEIVRFNGTDWVAITSLTTTTSTTTTTTAASTTTTTTA